MKIVITHSYFIEEDLAEQQIMKPYPPLGLLYVSGYLKQAGFDVEVFDSTFSNKEAWQAFMLEKQADVVFFYANLITKRNTLELTSFLKQHTQATLIGGGPDVTYNAKNYLSNGFDFLVVGEGEETSKELLTAFKDKLPWDALLGLAYLKDGALVQNPPRTKIKDLSELSLPDIASIDFNRYLDTWEKHHGVRMASVSTQRGCPYTCKWCSTAVYGQSYRRRPAELVAEEIEQLTKTYNIEGIWFVDDVFTVSHKWIKSLHAEFLNRKIKIRFECITRAERLTNEILDLLKEMGCFRIWIGAESGSQKIIDAMDRRVDIHKVREMINLTKEKGMEAGTFIMVGYPGEGLPEVKETVQHLKNATPSQLTATIAYPIKGTSLYTEIEEEISTPINWTRQTDRDLDFNRKHPRSFYQYALRYILNKYRFYSHTGFKKWEFALKAQILYLSMLRSKWF
jgi:anaerobic magnesium-protoporphyrin IX monomethyl ester cyclase